MTTIKELIKRIEAIREEETAAIAAAASTSDLENVRGNVFGKKGRLSGLLRSMGDLPAEDRPAAGKASNEAKARLQELIDARAGQLRRAEIDRSIGEETVDVTLPGIAPRVGSLHPVTQTRREIEDIFTAMGFSIELGPDVEDDYHNFEALNIPPDHPARDMHDTFYLESGLLLRTHTSPVQIHTMSAHKPPMAFIAPGKVYRCDADVTHSPMFHQIEGFMVDANVRFSDLKGVLESFIHQMFGPDALYRFRPDYFPFTEPSAEVDVLFERRHPSGRTVRDGLEVLGAGMIHPKVLENCGINPEEFTGFAFGFGVERMAMLKFGVNAISLFFENDVRFLRQFR